MELIELKQKMLFAAIWKERKEGGYNSYDFEPFVALKKVNNQGVDAYEGYNLTEWKCTKDMKTKVRVGNFCYKPLTFFKHSGDDRIIISNDLDEICEIFLERWH
jgi:hypothetical protein